MFRKIRFLLITVVVLALAAGAYTFAAANTIEDSAAGYKDSVVSGYAITNIVYGLNATDPTQLDNILLDVTPITGTAVAKTVKIQTLNAGPWIDCSSGLVPITGNGVTATCTTTGVALIDVTALNVVASSSVTP